MSPLLVKLIGGAAIALMLALFVHQYREMRAKLRADETQLEEILKTVRIMADNKGMKREDIVAQLWLIDAATAELERAAAECSSKVDALGAESARLQRASSAARTEGQARRDAAERSRGALEASALRPANDACLSPELLRRWH